MKKLKLGILLLVSAFFLNCNTVNAQEKEKDTPKKEKKGWSKKGKGAVIGGAAGAATGAVIGGKKGAVIGGAAGAGTGAVIGNKKDKKDKKEAEEREQEISENKENE